MQDLTSAATWHPLLPSLTFIIRFSTESSPQGPRELQPSTFLLTRITMGPVPLSYGASQAFAPALWDFGMEMRPVTIQTVLLVGLWVTMVMRKQARGAKNGSLSTGVIGI